MSKRIEREKRTVSLMIRMYCRNLHSSGGDLCDKCAVLRRYAIQRTENCKYGDGKPVCSACPVHCYKPEMGIQIREVMRYAGPRMLLRHPRYAIMHLIDERRSIPPLPPRARKGRNDD